MQLLGARQVVANGPSCDARPTLLKCFGRLRVPGSGERVLAGGGPACWAAIKLAGLLQPLPLPRLGRSDALGFLLPSHQSDATEEAAVEIEFLATVAVIAPDPPASRALYVDTLGLPLDGVDSDGYHHSEQIRGCKSFGVWPLSQAAEACFGTAHWPADRPVPQVSIEFDVTDSAAVAAAADELRQGGYELLHPAREEPWGQTVARLQSLEGVIVGISYTPTLHD
jgi:catechol 2,3-dioxygenase-like lactoylglutathione lyase family enzyme